MSYTFTVGSVTLLCSSIDSGGNVGFYRGKHEYPLVR